MREDERNVNALRKETLKEGGRASPLSKDMGLTEWTCLSYLDHVLFTTSLTCTLES